MPKARQEIPSDLYTQRVAALNAAVIRREELVARRKKKAKEWRHFIDALCMGLKAAVAGAFIGVGAWIWNMPEVGRKTCRLYVPGYRADGRGRTDAESHCTCCSKFGWLTGSAASLDWFSVCQPKVIGTLPSSAVTYTVEQAQKAAWVLALISGRREGERKPTWVARTGKCGVCSSCAAAGRCVGVRACWFRLLRAGVAADGAGRPHAPGQGPLWHVLVQVGGPAVYQYR